MTLKLVRLAWEAHEPLRLARFWGAALEWTVSDEMHDEVGLIPTDGTHVAFVFLPAADEKVGANRIHLDLSSRSAEDQYATVVRLIDLGARHIDIGQGPDEPHVVMADPEGNEFCVLEPGNSFVTYASRLGCLNCQGSRSLGYFWSAALGWALVWDQNDETAVRAPDGARQFISWGGYLPPKIGRNRLHFQLAPPPDGDQSAEVERLLSLGAKRVDIGPGEVSWIVLADPDDNEFFVLTPR